LIERLAPRRGKKAHPATKVFQALRDRVNDEIAFRLSADLEAALGYSQAGWTELAVIHFSSLEDRVVKRIRREKFRRDYVSAAEWILPEHARQQRAPEAEMGFTQGNRAGARAGMKIPASRSAQLRVLRKFEMAKMQKRAGGDHPVRAALKALFLCLLIAGSAVVMSGKKARFTSLAIKSSKESRLAPSAAGKSNTG